MGEEVHEAYKTLVAKCRAKGLGVCFFCTEKRRLFHIAQKIDRKIGC